MGRREKNFRPAGMHGSAMIVGRKQTDLIALARLADRDCDRALIAADDCEDLLLGESGARLRHGPSEGRPGGRHNKANLGPPSPSILRPHADAAELENPIECHHE